MSAAFLYLGYRSLIVFLLVCAVGKLRAVDYLLQLVFLHRDIADKNYML